MTPATVQAAAALAVLHAASFPPLEAWGPGAIATMLGQPGGFGWQAGEAGFVLVRVAADQAEILTLAVVPAARRKGVGAALLGAALGTAAGRGAGSMFLEVAAGNGAARALYARAAFHEVGRRPRYYRDGDDALVLERRLSPLP